MLLAYGMLPTRVELDAGLKAQRYIHVTDAVLHKLAGVKDSEGEMKGCCPQAPSRAVLSLPDMTIPSTALMQVCAQSLLCRCHGLCSL